LSIGVSGAEGAEVGGVLFIAPHRQPAVAAADAAHLRMGWKLSSLRGRARLVRSVCECVCGGWCRKMIDQYSWRRRARFQGGR